MESGHLLRSKGSNLAQWGEKGENAITSYTYAENSGEFKVRRSLCPLNTGTPGRDAVYSVLQAVPPYFPPPLFSNRIQICF